MAIKNRQPRDTGNTGHTSIEAQNNTETKKMSNMDPTIRLLLNIVEHKI